MIVKVAPCSCHPLAPLCPSWDQFTFEYSGTSIIRTPLGDNMNSGGCPLCGEVVLFSVVQGVLEL